MLSRPTLGSKSQGLPLSHPISYSSRMEEVRPPPSPKSLDFPIEDLVEWIEQSIADLARDNQSAALDPANNHFALGMVVAAGVCLAFPQARMLIVSAHLDQDAVSQEARISAPSSCQCFAVELDQWVLSGGVPMSLGDISERVVGTMKNDLDCHGLSHLSQWVVATTQHLDSEEREAFCKGGWMEFIAAGIQARYQASRNARDLEGRLLENHSEKSSSSSSTPTANSPGSTVVRSRL